MIRPFAIAIVLLSAGHAAAQDDEPDPLRPVLESAVTAFERGEYQVALDRFDQVYELAPRASLRFNIGMCLERLGRLREAVETYEAALASGELDAEGHARAQAQLDGVRPRLATVAVDSPAGAELVVDEDMRCDVPCRLELDPGTHVLVLREGEARRSRRVTLAPGSEERVRFDVPTSPDVLAPPAPREDDTGYSPGLFTWLGAGLAAVGGAGIVGFGLRTDTLHEEYLANPDDDTADEGETMMLLANVSIGVAAVGGILVLLDILTSL